MVNKCMKIYSHLTDNQYNTDSNRHSKSLLWQDKELRSIHSPDKTTVRYNFTSIIIPSVGIISKQNTLWKKYT